MHLAIDLDDVVVDFYGGVMAMFEREFGEAYDYDGKPWGEKAVAFTKHPRLLAAGYRSWWDWLRERDWLWGTFKAVDGAIGGLRQLRYEGHYLEGVTSKPDWAEHNVWKWLGDWRPPFHAMRFTKKNERKVDATSAALIVDDKLETCEQFVYEGRRAINFAPGAPDYAVGYPRLYIARDWKEVIEHVHHAEEAMSNV